jgi:hypothetical protein
MKKLSILLLAFGVVFTSCDNSAKKETKSDPQKAVVDSLEKAVDEGHMVGMQKMGKLKSMKFEAEKKLDSIAKLPEAAKEAAGPLKAKLDALVTDLSDAKAQMDKWMSEYVYDSAVNDPAQRIKYLTDENGKVTKMKEAILGSLQRADSLLKK